MPVSVRICFIAPAPANINSIIAISFTESVRWLIKTVIDLFFLIPKLNNAYSTEMTIAIGGSPIAIKKVVTALCWWISCWQTVATAIKITGKKVVKTLLNRPGSSASLISFEANVSGGLLVYFFKRVANKGPGMITAGIAIS